MGLPTFSFCPLILSLFECECIPVVPDVPDPDPDVAPPPPELKPRPRPTPIPIPEDTDSFLSPPPPPEPEPEPEPDFEYNGLDPVPGFELVLFKGGLPLLRTMSSSERDRLMGRAPPPEPPPPEVVGIDGIDVVDEVLRW